jgi:hypothetical protein
MFLFSREVVIIKSSSLPDFGMVKESECESNNLNRLTYTQQDKKILRQFEGAAGPAKHLSLFLQGESYLLFTI